MRTAETDYELTAEQQARFLVPAAPREPAQPAPNNTAAEPGQQQLNAAQQTPPSGGGGAGQGSDEEMDDALKGLTDAAAQLQHANEVFAARHLQNLMRYQTRVALEKAGAAEEARTREQEALLMNQRAAGEEGEDGHAGVLPAQDDPVIDRDHGNNAQPGPRGADVGSYFGRPRKLQIMLCAMCCVFQWGCSWVLLTCMGRICTALMFDGCTQAVHALEHSVPRVCVVMQPHTNPNSSQLSPFCVYYMLQESRSAQRICSRLKISVQAMMGRRRPSPRRASSTYPRSGLTRMTTPTS